MKYRVKNQGEVDLSKRDFVTSGGEGAVYVKGSTAYKIYLKPSATIPELKIQELSVITNPNVIKPEALLLDAHGSAVGYSMRFVADTHALCQLFTKAFKERNGVSPEAVIRLVQGLRQGVSDVHASNVLIVDLNEMNFLVEKDFKEVYFIDADSYQTRNFPATALMDSVKDWHAKGKWTTGSDWFSFGIVSFQLFAGIHPYKGKHPTINSIAERMQKNISVFNAEVSVPRMVPSFDVIPEVYRAWYKAVFETGQRLAPPVDMLAVAYVAPIQTVQGTDQLSIVQLASCTGNILRFEKLGDQEVSLCEKSIYWLTPKNAEVSLPSTDPLHLALLPDGEVVCGSLHRGLVQLTELRKQCAIDINLHAQQMMSYDGRLYVHTGEHILEIQFMKCGTRYVASSAIVANVMPQATRVFDGVVIQDMLGSWYASVFPKSKSSYQIRLQELEGYKIVDAKFDTRVLIVICSKAGKYDKFIFRFDIDFQSYRLWKTEDITYSGVNFVVLANGICAHINENEELMLFSSLLRQDAVKTITDPVLSGDMRLFKRGNEVLFARGKDLFRISTTK